VRQQRKKDVYNPVFSNLDEAIEDATDGLIEISALVEVMLRGDYLHQPTTTGDVEDLQALQESLTDMKNERDELFSDLRAAQQQLQKYADDLSTLYAQERAKRAELAVAYERLKESDRLKSDFLGTITHELGSPLVPVDFSLQIVEKGSLSGEQQHSLGEAKKLLGQYRRQLDGIIKYATLVSQSQAMQPERFMVGDFLFETLDPLILLAQGRRIEVNVHELEDALEVKADREMVGNALYQLVHNAIKFNHVGGTVDVEVFRSANQVVFQISDSGSGIPDEVMERMGQDFNQMVDGIRRGVEGLGLGLALANYVASAHQGKLVAKHGRDGSGTIMQFWIPVEL
jgi:signal transduction histidine kinase